MPNLKTHCPVFLARVNVHKSYQGQWATLYSRQIIKSITLSSLWLQKTLVVNKEMMHFFKASQSKTTHISVPFFHTLYIINSYFVHYATNLNLQGTFLYNKDFIIQ